jgi:hypothetical protein
MGVNVLIRVFLITPDSPGGESGFIRDRPPSREKRKGRKISSKVLGDSPSPPYQGIKSFG